MALLYSIENDVVEFLFFDKYTYTEFKRTCYGVLSDPAFKPTMKGLANLLHAEPNPPAKEMEECAEFLGSLKERFISSWSVLTQPEGRTYGLARMFSVFAEENGMAMDVFTERAHAMAALCQPNASVDSQKETALI